MSLSPTELLTVYLCVENRKKVGRLALKDRRILFEYDPDFIKTGIELSPIKLPLKEGVCVSPDPVFDGLFGLFNDSLPDGWGRLLLDRTVEKHGIPRRALTALDRLAYVGAQGMGALGYEPDRSITDAEDADLSLDRLAEESAIVLSGENEEVFEELLCLNGSSAGARPKIVVQVSDDKKRIIHGARDPQQGFEDWMIKFPSSLDPRDAGALEYAYSLMAKEAGIEMPETHLFASKKDRFFGTKRFDRRDGKRLHMHSLSGLIHADHRSPCLDYDTILRVTLSLTRSVAEAEKLYALACFNVIAHNRDDHAKNFSFLLTAHNEWVFAPAYDLTFSYGPNGEQSTMVMGEGKKPCAAHLQTLGKKQGLKNAEAILDRVHQTISRWRHYADLAGVSAKTAAEVEEKVSLW